jgi:hypothetical protein
VRDYADFSPAAPQPAIGVAVPLTADAILSQAKALDSLSPAVAPSPATAAETPSTDAGQSAGAASTDDDRLAASRAWADRAIAAINAADDVAGLATAQTKYSAGLEKLRAALPDMAGEIDAAIAARLASFETSADDDGTWRTNPLIGG